MAAPMHSLWGSVEIGAFNASCDYIALMADAMQSSLVQIFGDPTRTSIDANSSSMLTNHRSLAENLPTDSGSGSGSDGNSVGDEINTIVDHTVPLGGLTDVFFDDGNNTSSTIIQSNSTYDTVCWKECIVVYPLSTKTVESEVDAPTTEHTVCWDKCIDLERKSNENVENERCVNQCLTLDPTIDKTDTAIQTTGGATTTSGMIEATNSVNSSGSVSFILFQSTSNITDKNTSGIFFDDSDRSIDFEDSILYETINSNQYDIVCWKYCDTITPTISPTLRPWMDLLEDINTTSEMDEEEWNPNNLSDGEILQQTLELYGTIFVVCITMFCVARRVYPRPFNLRSGWISEDVIQPNPRAKKPETLGWVSWIWKVWLISDTELSDECGMDALCLSRVLEWGVRITAFGSLVGCIILMPVYATAGGAYAEENGIERLNSGNVPDGSDMHFVATVISAYLIFGFVMYTTLDEFEWFYRFRYQFLSRPIPRNYVVYVRNLEKENRTRKALIEYFSHFEDPSPKLGGDEERISLLLNNSTNRGSNSEVQTKAWVALKIPHLRKLVEKRATVLSKLEHNINIQDVCNRYPKTRCETTGVVITVVDALFQELKDLNAEIKIAIERIEMRARLEDPLEYNAEDYQNPYEVDGSDNGDFKGGHEMENASENIFFDTIPITPSMDKNATGGDDKSGDEPSRVMEEDEEYLHAAEELGRSMDESEKMHSSKNKGGRISSVDMTGNSERDDQEKPNGSRYLNPLGKVGTAAKVVGKQVERVAGTAVKQVERVAGTAVDAVGTAAHVVVGQATNVANLILSKDDDGAPMTAGFVAFSTLKACQAAKQMSHSTDVFGMEVLEAPGFDDIFWHNVGKGHKELQMGILMSFLLTATLCLFWTVVMTFIATLSSVQGLTQIVPFIGVWLEKAPWLEMVLAQISPLMIILADQLLKVILEILSKLEGPVSGMEVEASLFTKISVFKIIQTFFVNAVSGSLVSQLSAIRVIAKDPSQVITLLANALPNRSAFFIQILLVDTFISLSMELLRVSYIALAIVRSFVGPSLTEDERRTTWMGLRPLADPFVFRYAEILGGSVLYFVVFFVYAPLAPITSVFMFFCFLIMGAAYRHQFIFIYPTLPDSGGKLWIQFMKVVPTSLFIAEFTVSGFLAAKSAPVASALMIPLIGLTILFNIYIRQKHFRATDYLPGCMCVEKDLKNNIDGPMDLRFISNHYMQPELCDKELYPSNASLALQIKHGMIESPELP